MTVYVYGVVAASAHIPDTLRGVEDAAVWSLPYENIAAVVSSRAAEPLRASASSLKAHSRVLDQLTSTTTVLPLRFGTVLTDEESVVDSMLRPNAGELESLLDRLDGHVQLTVKVFHDEDEVITDIVRSDTRVRQLSKKVQGVPPAAAYYDRITLGQEIARAVEERKHTAAGPLFEALAPLSSDAVTKDLRQNLLVLDADFLVPRRAVNEFDAAVDSLAQKHPELEFRYLGPMPAYSFAVDVLEGS